MNLFGISLGLNRNFGFAENRMHLGNAEKSFLYFSYAPNLLSNLKVGAKEKTNEFIWHFARFSLSLQKPNNLTE